MLNLWWMFLINAPSFFLLVILIDFNLDLKHILLGKKIFHIVLYLFTNKPLFDKKWLKFWNWRKSHTIWKFHTKLSFKVYFANWNRLNAIHIASQHRYYEYFVIPRGEFLFNLDWFGFWKMAHFIVK